MESDFIISTSQVSYTPLLFSCKNEEVLEREIEKDLIEFFEMNRVMVLKIPKFRDRLHKTRHNDLGCPDLILFHKGVTVCLEVKNEAGRQSEDQKRFEERLRAHKIPYFVCRSLDDAKIQLRAIYELALS